MSVQRRRVVDAGLDSRGLQPCRHGVAVLEPRRKQVVHARSILRLRQEPRRTRQQLAVLLRVPPPRGVPAIEMRELDAQERRLEPIKTLVETDLDVLALAALTEVTEAS